MDRDELLTVLDRRLRVVSRRIDNASLAQGHPPDDFGVEVVGQRSWFEAELEGL